MAEWVIREEKSGRVEIFRNRRRLGDDRSVEAGRAWAEREMAEGDSLIHEAPDGYRARLKGKRRGWRQAR